MGMILAPPLMSPGLIVWSCRGESVSRQTGPGNKVACFFFIKRYTNKAVRAKGELKRVRLHILNPLREQHGAVICVRCHYRGGSRFLNLSNYKGG